MNQQITDLTNLLPGKSQRVVELPEAVFPRIAVAGAHVPSACAAMDILAFEVRRQFVIAVANARAMIAYANEHLEPGRQQIKAESFLTDTLNSALDLGSDIEARAEMIQDSRS